MELRNHPKMVYKGQRNWPPRWIPLQTRIAIGASGEVGVLKEVRHSTVSDWVCYLTIVYQNNSYFGSIYFDDSEFAKRICELLKQNCGRSLADIGSLDVG